MSADKTSYRQIMKATSIFGGVQVFTIIIAIIRSKFIAILLGPTGMGIYSLLNSTTSMITSITSFGLGTSAVKNIAEANGTGNKERVATVAGVFRRLVWFTGLLGSVSMLVLSSWLSELTFGSKEYTIAFVWISITLLVNQLTTGNYVILRGMRKINFMAQASLAGSFIGLLVTIPLYYIWGVKGIVPAIIISSFIALFLSIYFSNKIKIDKILLTKTSIVVEGKKMLVMGFMISLTGILDQIIAYVTRLYIIKQSDIETVGLYNAGFAIVNTYVGMIFTAMLTDYYPRLSAIATDNAMCKKEINQQAEVAILILSPIILVFLVFAKFGIVLLYSQKFLGINEMILWAMLGVYIKAANWSMGIIVLAKGESLFYFLTYILATIIMLGSNIAGFYFWGLKGLGIGFLLSYSLLTIIGLWLFWVRYSFSFTLEFAKIFFIQFGLGLTCFAIVMYVSNPINFFFGFVLIVISSYFSYRELDKRIGIKQILIDLIKRLKTLNN